MPQAPKHSWEAEETEEEALGNMDDIVGDDTDKVNPMEGKNALCKLIHGVPKGCTCSNIHVFQFSNHPHAVSDSTPSHEHQTCSDCNLEATQNGLWSLCPRCGAYLPSAPRLSTPYFGGVFKGTFHASLCALVGGVGPTRGTWTLA